MGRQFHRSCDLDVPSVPGPELDGARSRGGEIVEELGDGPRLTPRLRVASRLPAILSGAFAVEFAALAWAPYDRGDWLLENLIPVPVVVWFVLARRRLPLSGASWCLVFSFLALHEIGSHFTYSRVPWMEWSRDLIGWAPAWERNHYDRFVHLAFGLLLTRPIAELLAQPLAGSPRLRRVLPVCCLVTLSAAYELLEWGAAAIVEPDLGIAFVGAQGDIWDAQKDMSLALCGSCVATAIVWAARRARQRLRHRGG